MAVFSGSNTSGNPAAGDRHGGRSGRSGRSGGPNAARSAAADLSLQDRFKALRNLPPLFRLVWTISPWMTAANVTLRIVKSVLPVAMLYVGKLIIDEVILVAGGGHDFATMRDWLNSGVLNHLWLLLGVEFALAILSDAIGRGTAFIDSLLGDLFTNETSVRLIAHAATLDLAHFEDADFYDQLERARRQTTGRMILVTQVLTQAQNIITIASFAVGLVIYAPWLILLLALALVPAFLGEAHFNAQSYSLNYSWTPERRELDYLRMIGASDATAKEVKIFGLNDFITRRYKELADAFYAANRKLAIRRASWGGVLAAVGSAGYYGAYVIIVYRTARGEFTVGDLTFLAGSFSRLRGLLAGLLTSFSTVAGQALYLEDLFSFLEIKPTVASPENPRSFPTTIASGFVFENVGFRYPGTDRWVLRDLSFTLQAGEALALVGENGAGKTTLVKLLARLYDPSEGRILLDGHDLREYALEEVRANIGVIFQDFVRYHFTASDNIAVGRIEERLDRPRIEDAAERSLADTVIDKLPNGYEQVVGRRFREGVELSGGEWQKIALGRAYMRDAQLLILDEPTAALDARAEYEVFQRFKDLTAGKTAVLISHRFSTVRMADRILVLGDGRLEEIGTHDELVAAQGKYAELFELQAAGYR